MAKTLSSASIATSQTILAAHVTQSIDALTGTDAYDITISGSLQTTGSVGISGLLSATPGITHQLTASNAVSASFGSLTNTTNRWNDGWHGNDEFIDMESISPYGWWLIYNEGVTIGQNISEFLVGSSNNITVIGGETYTQEFLIRHDGDFNIDKFSWFSTKSLCFSRRS